MNIVKKNRALLLGLVLSQAIAVAAVAQPAGPPRAMPPHGQKDFKLAPAGTYALDSNHAAVIARLSHMGYSISVFRFDKVTGTLTWDPAAPTKSTLKVKVETASVATNVKDFPAEIAGDKFLKSAANPDATFVSTAFRQTDATHGKVDGQLTLMGKINPVTFDVTLIGAGPGFGKPRIGVEATAAIKPEDYGLTLMGGPVDLVIDTEFERQQ